MKDEELWATARAAPSGENLQLRPIPPGSVDGSANFVPKPDPLQGYTVMKGLD
jgi:hypothetical protein